MHYKLKMKKKIKSLNNYKTKKKKHDLFSNKLFNLNVQLMECKTNLISNSRFDIVYLKFKDVWFND